MTQVQIYESVFRRANIPYQTVLGRGFYEREEITDLIQLLRFLDNKTDEIALAAVFVRRFVVFPTTPCWHCDRADAR